MPNYKPHKYLHSTTFDSNLYITDWKDCKQAWWHFNISGMVMVVERTARLSLKLTFSRYQKLCCIFLSCWQSVLLVIPQSWWCNGVGLSPIARNAVAPSQPPVLTTISLQILTNLAAQLCVVMPQEIGVPFPFLTIFLFLFFFALFWKSLRELSGFPKERSDPPLVTLSQPSTSLMFWFLLYLKPVKCESHPFPLCHDGEECWYVGADKKAWGSWCSPLKPDKICWWIIG